MANRSFSQSVNIPKAKKLSSISNAIGMCLQLDVVNRPYCSTLLKFSNQENISADSDKSFGCVVKHVITDLQTKLR